MSTSTEQQPQQQSLRPDQFPMTQPQMMSRFITDTGKILPRKYTGLCAHHQRAVTKTLKQARNNLLAQ